MLIVFVVTLVAFGFVGGRAPVACVLRDLQWLLMSLTFEFLLAHSIAGRSRSALWPSLSVAGGDLFSLELAVIVLTRYAVAGMKGAFERAQ